MSNGKWHRPGIYFCNFLQTSYNGVPRHFIGNMLSAAYWVVLKSAVACNRCCISGRVMIPIVRSLIPRRVQNEKLHVCGFCSDNLLWEYVAVPGESAPPLNATVILLTDETDDSFLYIVTVAVIRFGKRCFCLVFEFSETSPLVSFSDYCDLLVRGFRIEMTLFKNNGHLCTRSYEFIFAENLERVSAFVRIKCNNRLCA